MSTSEAVLHGGNVDQLATDYGIPPESILDFSANINPRGLPQQARMRLAQAAADTALLARYPDPNYQHLRGALARKLQVPVEALAVGGGASALLESAISALRPRRCLIPVPAFAEYARACASAGAKIGTVSLSPKDNFRLDPIICTQALRTGKFDCVILNNPHNPSGALLSRSEMLAVLDGVRTAGAVAIVDEAFIDYAHEASVIQHAVCNTNVVVIRSLTKFYGCAGLRVGFLAAAPETLARIVPSIPTWPVGTLAATALEWAIRDEEFASATLRENAAERENLLTTLTALGAHVFPSGANFLLLRLKNNWPDSTTTKDLLLRRCSVAIRDCNSYAGLDPGRYIRIAVRAEEDNRRLLKGLTELWK